MKAAGCSLVTVDGQSQNPKQRRSRLELAGTSPNVEVIQASTDAYAEYPRELLRQIQRE